MRLNRALVAGLSFAEATARYNELQNTATAAAKPLRQYPRGLMGLTPDHIKATAEWRKARLVYQRAADDLRAFSAAYANVFRKEIRLARRQRIAAMPTTNASSGPPSACRIAEN